MSIFPMLSIAYISQPSFPSFPFLGFRRSQSPQSFLTSQCLRPPSRPTPPTPIFSGAIGGMPQVFFGRSRVSSDFSRGKSSKGTNVVAKIVKKEKLKHEGHIDEIEPHPNVKGGILSCLSEFKSLKEKTKPVTLLSEMPLVNLKKKIIDVQKMAAETRLDFTDQIISLESKYEQIHGADISCLSFAVEIAEEF